MVNLQALAHGFFFVVFALNQLITSHVILARDFRRVMVDVIDAARTRMYATPGHTRNNLFVSDSDFQHVIQLDTRIYQRFSLRNSARKAIKQKTIGAVILSDTFLDQTDDQIIGDQPATVHDFLDLLTQISTRLDRCTQHVASRNLRNTETLTDKLCLGTLARTRGA